MMKKNILYFGAIVLFQLVMLWAIIYRYSTVLLYWEKVIIKAIPVDPRDYFRGDYVILGYDINSYEISTWQNIFLKENDNVFIVPKFNSGWVVDGIKNISLEVPLDTLYFKWKIRSISWIANFKVKVFSWNQEHIKDYKMEYYNDYYQKKYIKWEKVALSLNMSGDIQYLYEYNDDFKESSDMYSSTKKWEIVEVSNIINKFNIDYWVDRFFVKEWTGKEIEDEISKDWVYAVWKVKNGKIVVESLIVNGKIVE